MSHRRPVLGELGQPASIHPGLRLRGPGIAGQQYRRAGRRGAQDQHVAGVRVRCALLGQQVVAVVPQPYQAQVGDGGVGRRAVADHHLDLPSPRRQEGTVTGGGTRLGHQDGERSLPQRRGTGGCQPLQVPLVGHHQHRPTTPVGAGPGRLGQSGGPVPAGRRARRHLPQGPWPAPVPQRAKKPRTRRVAGQGARRRLLDQRRRRLWFGLLGGRVPGRHGQPHHVGESTGVVVGDRTDQRRHLTGEHRLGRDDLVQRSEPALVVAGRAPLQHEPVAQPTGEAHSDPGAGDGLGVLLRRHRVVERPVQMGQRHIHGHRGDRQQRLRHTRILGSHHRQAAQVTPPDRAEGDLRPAGEV